LLAVVSSVAVAQPAPPAGADRFAGLWRGMIVNKPAELEVEIVVEIGPGAGGGLAGTIDVPTYRLEYIPLEGVKVDGERIEFGFRRHSEAFGEGALSRFEGTLDAGGDEIRGEYTEAGGARRLAFELARAGEAGAPRPEPVTPPLHALSARGEELRTAFNADADRVRLLILMSPT
jgi:hypothetical protein